MRLILSFFLLTTVFFISAQSNVLIKGYVVDKETKQALSFAAVQVKNSQLGSLSGEDGYFELPVPTRVLSDSLKISFIGYQPTIMNISGYSSKDTLRILLDVEITAKAEVPIVAYSAKRVLLLAIENLKKNLYTDSIIETGLYRQYHKENGGYVRLIEADISVAFNTKNPFLYAQHEQVRVNNDRRSENYETNGDVHGDHLVDLLRENPFSYNKSTLLNPKNVDLFAPKFESEDSAQYVLRTQYKESSSEKIEQARIWVEKETFAILRIEIEKFPNPLFNYSKYRMNSRWKLVNEKVVIDLEKIDGKFFVSSLQRVYNHHVLNRITQQVDFIVEETFELYFSEYQTKNIWMKMYGSNFSNMTSLYTSKHPYDERFWNSYKLLEEYPTPSAVKSDLQHAERLEDQFLNMDK